MPRGRVGGLRSAASREQGNPEDSLPALKQDKFQFRSKNGGYRVSLTRRQIDRGPDGQSYERALRTKRDNAKDWVAFEEHTFETDDPELAKLIREAPGFGLPSEGGEFWSLEDERAAREAAEERELRHRLSAVSPDVRERVLKPSEAEDLSVPPVN